MREGPGAAVGNTGSSRAKWIREPAPVPEAAIGHAPPGGVGQSLIRRNSHSGMDLITNMIAHQKPGT